MTTLVIDQRPTPTLTLPATAARAADWATLSASPAEPATLPDLDQDAPAGLRWVCPPEERPIKLGHDYPELRPVLDIDAARFWSAARHGRAVGAAEFALDVAAIRHALSANPRRAHAARAALTLAAIEFDDAVADYYAQELTR